MSAIQQLIIAGWTGRDEAALRKHIKELEEIGVKPPKTTPIFYRVSANLFCHAEEIQVSGPDTSGEVEFVLIQGAELRSRSAPITPTARPRPSASRSRSSSAASRSRGMRGATTS